MLFGPCSSSIVGSGHKFAVAVADDKVKQFLKRKLVRVPLFIPPSMCQVIRNPVTTMSEGTSCGTFLQFARHVVRLQIPTTLNPTTHIIFRNALKILLHERLP